MSDFGRGTLGFLEVEPLTWSNLLPVLLVCTQNFPAPLGGRHRAMGLDRGWEEKSHRGQPAAKAGSFLGACNS